MSSSVFVYDPTIRDELSKVRGVGRYLQILRENFADEFTFTNNLSSIIHRQSSILINPFFNFLQPPLTFRRLAKKQIAVIHDLIPLKYPSHFPVGIKGTINILLNKLALRNYDIIITDSEASKRDIVNILKLPEKKIKVVYPCLPKIFLTKSNTTIKQFNNLTIPPKFCLYVGDATWNKNLANLARAIKIINVTGVFVGKVFENLTLDTRSLRLDLEAGNLKLENLTSDFQSHYPASSLEHPASNLFHPWQKELKQFFQEIKNDRRFILIGFLPDNELLKLYQQARVNVLPSRDEGFGFSFLEAASQGCPSVLGDIPVLKEIAGDTAWFANPDDLNEIANKVGEIYFNVNLRDQLGFKAQEKAKFFSGEKFKKQFLNIL